MVLRRKASIGLFPGFVSIINQFVITSWLKTMDQETRTQIDEIKRRHPIQEVAARYLELRLSGDRLIGHCPFHDDRRPSFSIHLPTETWCCYAASCDLNGD